MNRILKITAAAAAVLSSSLSQASIFINTNANCYVGPSGDPANPFELQSRTSVSEFPPTFKWSFMTNMNAYFANSYPLSVSSGPLFIQVYAEAKGYHTRNAVLVAGNNYGFDGFAYYSVPTSTSVCSGVHIVIPTSTAVSADQEVSAAQNGDIVDTSVGDARAIQPFVGIRIGTAADVPTQLATLKQQPTRAAARSTLAAAARATPSPRLMSMAQIAAARGSDGLQVASANIATSSLQGLRMMGAMPSGARTAAGWTGLTRIFHTTGGDIVLDELDLAASGGGAIVMRELINADVNGAPARFEVAKTPDGESAFLTWFTSTKRMSLTAPADADARVKLLAIARALY